MPSNAYLLTACNQLYLIMLRYLTRGMEGCFSNMLHHILQH